MIWFDTGNLLSNGCHEVASASARLKWKYIRLDDYTSPTSRTISKLEYIHVLQKRVCSNHVNVFCHFVGTKLLVNIRYRVQVHILPCHINGYYVLLCNHHTSPHYLVQIWFHQMHFSLIHESRLMHEERGWTNRWDSSAKQEMWRWKWKLSAFGALVIGRRAAPFLIWVVSELKVSTLREEYSFRSTQSFYRVTHLLANLGWVDFGLCCSILCQALPGLTGNCQMWLSR